MVRKFWAVQLQRPQEQQIAVAVAAAAMPTQAQMAVQALW
jgi:hypothetical protein